mgnify:CR=1 FL=1
MDEFIVPCSEKHRNFLYKTPIIDNYDNILIELKNFIYSSGYLDNLSIDSAKQFDWDYFRDQCPKLYDWFDSQGIACSVAKVLNVPPYTQGWIHSDIGEKGAELALNIGIENAVNNWNIFYKIKGRPENTSSTPGQNEPWIYFNEGNRENVESIDEIGRYDLTLPKIFNTRIPHRVLNFTESRRIVTTFRFDPDLDINAIKFYD